MAFVQAGAPTSQDPSLIVLALVVVVFCASGLIVSGLYSIPYALERVKRYNDPGSAKRMFAFSALVSTVVPAACLVLFLGTGIAALFVADNDLRAAISRALLVTGIILLCVMVVIVPILHRYTEIAADREEREERRRLEDEQKRLEAEAEQKVIENTNKQVTEMNARDKGERAGVVKDQEGGETHRKLDLEAAQAERQEHREERKADRDEQKEERKADRAGQKEERRQDRIDQANEKGG